MPDSGIVRWMSLTVTVTGYRDDHLAVSRLVSVSAKHDNRISRSADSSPVILKSLQNKKN